jgi:ADP-ribosylglycohydrolase
MTGNPRERATGSLLGLAVGDCLGAALEGRPPPPEPVRDLIHDPTVWTDDTQQALVLAEATIRLGGPNPEWVANRFAEMNERGLHRRTGSGFRSAVERVGLEGDWRLSGRDDRVGNGAAMRIAPTAVACAAVDPDGYWKRLVQVSLVTHRELCSIAGALAVGWVAACQDRGDAFRLLGELGEWLRERETWMAQDLPFEWGGPVAPAGGDPHAVSAALLSLAGDPPADFEDGLERIASNASAHLGKPLYAGSGYVLASVVTAVYVAVTSDGNFEETLVRAVNLGGDTDTIGAMVGGMVGATTGPDVIPDRWLRFPGAEEVRAWGEALGGRRSTDGLPDLIEVEQRLSEFRSR